MIVGDGLHVNEQNKNVSEENSIIAREQTQMDVLILYPSPHADS